MRGREEEGEGRKGKRKGRKEREEGRRERGKRENRGQHWMSFSISLHFGTNSPNLEPADWLSRLAN